MAAATPPPMMWASDQLRADQYAGGQAMGTARHTSTEQVAEAYRHVRQLATDTRRDFDLYDLLSTARREETYQPYFQGVSAQRWALGSGFGAQWGAARRDLH
jgi:hypothetical protein